MSTKSALLASAAAAAVLATVSPVQAGAYVSIFGGWNATDDVAARSGSNGTIVTSATTTVLHTPHPATPHTLTFSFTAVSAFANSGAKAEDGWVVGAAVGGDLGSWLPGLRAEVEGSYRRNSLGAATANASASDTDLAPSFYGFGGGNVVHSCGITPVAPMGVVSGPPAPCTASLPGSGTFNFRDTFTTSNAFASGSGSISTFALMANVWYDIGTGSGLTPYLGGGIGYADHEVEHGEVINGTGGSFAWQLGAGVNFDIGERTKFGIGYRYMDAGELTIRRAPGVAGGPIEDVHEVTHQSVLLNLTFGLGK
jgi:opacity protein-like surface antigen